MAKRGKGKIRTVSIIIQWCEEDAETKAQSPRKRLLPSDRVILDALRARLPKGEQVTKPVRTRELIDVCEISRRQVQICLRRLEEKGLIKRILDGTYIGQQSGYRYQILGDTST
jgi:DNA-binding MarR family transcriptional regulator